MTPPGLADARAEMLPHRTPSRQSSHFPQLIGLVIGLSVALPMYLWQASPQVAIAAFVIAGYTAWLWAATAREIALDQAMRSYLRTMPVNRPWRRVGRMLIDPGYWWSLLFGCTMVTVSVWYTGLTDTWTLIAIGCAWGFVAVSLNYSLTLQTPTTRCRRCGYQLAAHLRADDPQQQVTCPECGAGWTKKDLCLTVGPPAAQPQKKAA